ncbi:MAG TPA: NEW3 domain-containing protein, partial [Candidatus Synoicihabitans sp.]|nr:NEW3 domain-containing protein [Candidatus Synoicihabitans sp.]
GRGGLTADGMVAVDVGGFDPLLGESYGEIAARSRTMHKSQGFGSVGSRGVALEHFAPLAGEPATEDLMDGVDTTWARIPGGAGITPAVTAVLAQFDPQQPSASVPALLTIHRQLAQIAESPVIAEKRAQLDRIIAGCLGLYVESRIAQAEAVPGDALPLRLTALRRSDFPVTWRTARIVGTSERTDPNAALEFNRAATAELRHALSPEARPTHPYWLSREGTVGMFAVDDPALIARPASPAALTLEHVFEVDGQTIVVADEPVEVVDDPVHGEIRRPLRIIPPVSFAFAQELELFAHGATRTVSVTITAARAAKGDVKLTAPAGWQVEPIESAFRLAAGERATMTFQVTAPGNASTAHLVAEATVDGQTYSHRRAEIRYAHLPPLLLQPPARIKVVSLELATRGQTIGYLPGAGDVVPEALARMGYRVTTLSLDDLQTENLRRFDAVVLGVRAYNTHGTIRARLPALFTYAAAGGTVVVQYNTTADLQTDTLAPYRLRLSRDRVTEEDARVTLLAPNHPAMQQPNRITSDDFDGWVQERGLYFPDQWDESFTPLLAAADTGEPQRSGGLLVARHGEGWFVYTGLSFFRQLPDGVPGAYRLFANLVSLGR